LQIPVAQKAHIDGANNIIVQIEGDRNRGNFRRPVRLKLTRCPIASQRGYLVLISEAI
jgi:hypothetical protein